MELLIDAADPIDALSSALYEWWREMEEQRMPTGFRVRVADTTTGPSGIAWASLNKPQKAEIGVFVSETLLYYGPAETSTWSFRFGMNRDLIEMSRAHVTSLATLLWPAASWRKHYAKHWLDNEVRAGRAVVCPQ